MGSSRKTPGPEACSAWRQLRSSFALASLLQGQDGVRAEYLLLTLDKLQRQGTFKVEAYIKKECNARVWLYLVGCTDELQPIDIGLGAHVKVGVGNHLDVWREDGETLER